MSALQLTLLSNALLVIPLALGVLVASRFVRRPQVRWALWGLVLLKFVTPAIVPLPVDVAMVGEQVVNAGSTGFQPVQFESADETHGLETLPAYELLEPAIPIDTSNSDIWNSGTWEGEAPAEPQPEFAPAIIDGDPVRELNSTAPLQEQEPSASSAIADIPPPSLETPAAAAAAEPPAPATPAATASINWLLLLWSIWLGGSVLIAALSLWRIVHFHRLLKRATPASAELLKMGRQLADGIGLKRLPAVRVTCGRVPPLLWGGLRRATILLPQDLLDTLDDAARRSLLAHELSHLAGRDHWTRRFELVVRCLYWWHPVTWWAAHRLREAEEQCCDARVVSLLPESAAAYAQAILTTVDYLAGDARAIPALATGLQPLRRSIRPLHRRLAMIVSEQPTRRTSWLSWLLIAALAAVVLPTTLIGEPAAEPDDAEQADEEVPVNSQPAQAVNIPALGPAPLAFDFATPVLPSDPTSAPDSRVFSFYMGFEGDHKGVNPDQAADDAKTTPAEKPKVIEWSKCSACHVDMDDFHQSHGQNWPRPAPDKAEQKRVAAEYEEITVVIRDYEMPFPLARAYLSSLGQISEAFVILDASMTPIPSAQDDFGSGIEQAGPVMLRITGPRDVHEAFGAFITAMDTKLALDPEADSYQLVKARYNKPQMLANSLAHVLPAYRELGLITPLFVAVDNGDLIVTTHKSVHEHIAELLRSLSGHWNEEPQAQPAADAFGAAQPPRSPAADTSLVPPTPYQRSKSPTPPADPRQRRLDVDVHTPWQIMRAVAAMSGEIRLTDNDETIAAIDYISSDPVLRGQHWFVTASDGKRPRVAESLKPYHFEGHPNQFAAWLLEAGVPLDHKLQTENGSITVGDLFEPIDPHENQTWTLMLVSHAALAGNIDWMDGKLNLLFTDLMELELKRGLDGSPDDGTSRLYAIVLARNFWRARHDLDDIRWQAADELIEQMIAHVRDSQQSNGALSLASRRDEPPPTPIEAAAETSQNLIWLAAALSPEELEAPWVKRAVEATRTGLKQMAEKSVPVDHYYASLHGLRAIARARVSQPPIGPASHQLNSNSRVR